MDRPIPGSKITAHQFMVSLRNAYPGFKYYVLGGVSARASAVVTHVVLIPALCVCS